MRVITKKLFNILYSTWEQYNEKSLYYDIEIPYPLENRSHYSKGKIILEYGPFSIEKLRKSSPYFQCACMNALNDYFDTIEINCSIENTDRIPYKDEMEFKEYHYIIFEICLEEGYKKRATSLLLSNDNDTREFAKALLSQ